MPSIRPLTWAGPPESRCSGAAPAGTAIGRARGRGCRRCRRWSRSPPRPRARTRRSGRGSSPRRGLLCSGRAPRRAPRARSPGDGDLVDLVPVQHGDQPGGHARPHLGDERREQGGAGAPDDVEPRAGVAVLEGGVAAPLGPADDRKEPDAALVQPGALLSRPRSRGGLPPTASASSPRPGRNRRCRTSPAGRARGNRARRGGAVPGSRPGTARRRTTRPVRRARMPVPARPGSPVCRLRPVRQSRRGRPGRTPRQWHRQRLGLRAGTGFIVAPVSVGERRAVTRRTCSASRGLPAPGSPRGSPAAVAAGRSSPRLPACAGASGRGHPGLP